MTRSDDPTPPPAPPPSPEPPMIGAAAGGGLDLAQVRRTLRAVGGVNAVLDLEGRIVFTRGLPCRRCGVTAKAMVGQALADGPWWQHDEKLRRRVRAAVRSAAAGKRRRLTASLWTLSGVRRAELHVAPLCDADDQPAYVLVTGRDTTHREVRYAQLDKTLHRVEIASAFGLMGVYEWDLENQTLTLDEAQRRLWGLAPDEIETTELLVQRILPEDLPRVEQIMEAMQRGEDMGEYEFRIRRLDGQVIWLAGRYTAQDETDGQIRTVYGINWDVTRRKQEIEQLHLAHAQRNLMLESADMGLWEVDLRTQMVKFDGQTARYFGVEPEGTLALEQALDRLYPEDRGGVAEAIDRAMDPAGDGRYVCEYRTLPTEGKKWFRAVGQVIFEGEGELRQAVRFVGGIKDATEEYQREAELREAQRAAEAANVAKGEFLANMSHEIRTPMTAILGFADIVASRLQDREDLVAVDTIRRNARFLVDILDDILDLSKLEFGKLEIRQDRFDPAAVLGDVRSLIEVRSAEKGLTFELDAQGPLPRTIAGDAKRFRQIMINLLGNAVKFTTTGGVRVVVAADADQQQLTVDVIDTGVGIRDEVIKTLFKPFAQGDASLVREYGGSGLGLEISRRLARMLGGDVTVRSQPDVGSTFRLTISTGDLTDIDWTDAAFSPRVQSPAPAKRMKIRLDGKRVLVADDREELRHLVRRLLESAGATVDEAADGRSVLEKLTEPHPYDAAILDMQMPVLDGYQAARTLRARGSKVPLVALTAHAMSGDEARCLKAGCDAYAVKPIDGLALLETVRRLIRAAGPRAQASPAAGDRAGEVNRAEAPDLVNSADGSAVEAAIRVLLVEDDEGLRYLMTRMLGPMGFDLQPAADGAEALRAVQADCPDVVLLDMGLPDIDGLTLYPALMQAATSSAAAAAPAAENGAAEAAPAPPPADADPPPPCTPPQVVAFTGRVDARTHDAIREVGIEHLVVKPPDFDQLAELIRRLAQQRRDASATTA